MTRDPRVRSYLERIGATADEDVVRLHDAHVRTVPFENLSIHLGEPIELDADALLDKIVVRRRGGFCYELNSAFAWLLRELGHDVAHLAARVYDGARLTPLFDHMALLVDGRWLADVGFGDHAIRPLEWGIRDSQEDPAGTFRLSDAERGDVDVHQDGRLVYRVESRPRELEDFAMACWYQQSSPRSHFTQSTTCSRPTPGGRITISGRRLIRTEGGERTETEIANDAELLAAYQEHFGIVLDRVPQVRAGTPDSGP